MKKGTAVIRNPEMRRLRALMMVEFKIKHSATHAEVAKEFGVSEETVRRTMSFAKKANLLVALEDRIMNELMGAAVDAVKRGLEDTDNVQEAAKRGIEMFKGIVPNFSKSQGPTKQDDGNELARYVAELRGDGDATDVLDGEVAGDALLLVPPAETAAPQEGDAGTSRGITDGLGAQSAEPT